MQKLSGCNEQDATDSLHKAQAVFIPEYSFKETHVVTSICMYALKV